MSVALDLVCHGETTRGLARLSPAAMSALDLLPGDTISLSGEKSTHVRALPAAISEGEVHADAIVCGNAGASGDARILVSRAPLHPLAKVTLCSLNGKQMLARDILDALFDMALTKGDRLVIPGPAGPAVEVEVLGTFPSDAGLVTEETSFVLEVPPADVPSYAGIGGLAEEIARVREVVAAPLLRPDLYARLGMAPPRGVLFSGPPGVGKTLLARAIANETGASFFQIEGPEVVSKHYGESEAALRRVFSAAERDAPSIVFIDEIDAIAPRRDDLSGDKQVERRVVSQLLTAMDGLADRGQIVVLAATNLPDTLDPALRRPGRFDREIAFTPPRPRQRQEILEVHLANAPLARDVALDRIAEAAHGYVGADLAALAREAGVAALSRSISEAGGEQGVDASRLFINQRDLEHGLSVTAPSALRGTGADPAPAGMSDLGGLDRVRDRLRELVEWPRIHRATFAAYRISPPRGVLLSGPPGCGKTLTARAMASETGLNFLSVRPTDILSRHFGDAERVLARLFAAARQAAPTLMFFDELDSIAPRRTEDNAAVNRIVAQFLIEMDGIAGQDDILVLGATNRAAAIDPALLRPGRFDVVIEIPTPDAASRRAILSVHLSGRPMGKDVDLERLSRDTNGATGADLAEMVAGAARDAAVREVSTGASDAICHEDLCRQVLRWRDQTRLRQTDCIGGDGDTP